MPQLKIYIRIVFLVREMTPEDNTDLCKNIFMKIVSQILRNANLQYSNFLWKHKRTFFFVKICVLLKFKQKICFILFDKLLLLVLFSIFFAQCCRTWSFFHLQLSFSLKNIRSVLAMFRKFIPLNCLMFIYVPHPNIVYFVLYQVSSTFCLIL